MPKPADPTIAELTAEYATLMSQAFKEVEKVVWPKALADKDNDLSAGEKRVIARAVVARYYQTRTP